MQEEYAALYVLLSCFSYVEPRIEVWPSEYMNLNENHAPDPLRYLPELEHPHKKYVGVGKIGNVFL